MGRQNVGKTSKKYDCTRPTGHARSNIQAAATFPSNLVFSKKVISITQKLEELCTKTKPKNNPESAKHFITQA